MSTLLRALKCSDGFQYRLPRLNYECSSLEPVLSTTLVSFQYKQFLKYNVDSLNQMNVLMTDEKFLGQKNLSKRNLEESFDFHHGGYTNMCLFLENLAPINNNGGTFPNDNSKITKMIQNTWGCYQGFMHQLSTRTENIPGNGWGFLAIQNKQFYILTLPDNETVEDQDIIPLLAINIWDYAYQYDYKQDRRKYLKNLWKIIDWGVVEKRFNEANK